VAFIKYNIAQGEWQAQLHTWRETKKQKGGVKVAEIYHAFEHERINYVMMEYVEGESLGEWLLQCPHDRERIYARVGAALRQLLDLPTPPGLRPGAVGGGCAHHIFFRDDVAPTEYASVGDLENHMNKVGRTDHPPNVLVNLITILQVLRPQFR
jgi:serine/threonine protein kinase